MLNFSNTTILVFGDLILDRYSYGKSNRISPESSALILNIEKTKSFLGRAANVAANIKLLSGNPILFGSIGNDNIGKDFISLCNLYKIDTNNIVLSNKITTEKTRLISCNSYLLRIDSEDDSRLESKYCDELLNNIEKYKSNDVLVISDYNKGVLNEQTSNNIFEIFKNKKIIIDPKPANKDIYKECYLITPNKKEAEQILNMSLNTMEDIELACFKLSKKYNSNVLITLGSEGMMLYDKENEPCHIKTKAQDVYDVCGAGDTVVAVISLCIAKGMTLLESAHIANKAAGIKVGKSGTSPVSIEELSCLY